MASATVKKVVEKVILNLTGAEARTLRTILSRVGGDPHRSLRMFSQNICNELERVGITHFENVFDDKNTERGHLMFKYDSNSTAAMQGE